MTIRQAIANGVPRIRQSQWAPDCYLRVRSSLLTMHGKIPPWLYMYHRVVQEVIGAPTPQSVPLLMVSLDEDVYQEYAGSIDREDVDS